MERRFLGFGFSANKQPKRRIAPKVLLRRKQKIRELTRPTRGISREQMLKELTAYVRGWKSYFGFCQTPAVLQALEESIPTCFDPDLDGIARSSGTDRYVNAGLLRHSLHKQRVGRTVHGGWRTARPCPSRFRSSASTLWVFLGCSRVLRSPLNRPMRTRMSGGAAEESERLPLCRFHEELLTLRISSE